MLEMFVASELHMTLSQLWDNCTAAEILLWQAYYTVRAEDRDK